MGGQLQLGKPQMNKVKPIENSIKTFLAVRSELIKPIEMAVVKRSSDDIYL
jgi:hypothetical protein